MHHRADSAANPQSRLNKHKRLANGILSKGEGEGHGESEAKRGERGEGDLQEKRKRKQQDFRQTISSTH